MRTTCPHCGKRYDIGHRDVLAEAARLARERPAAAVVRPGAEGNVLLPHDDQARRLREEAIRRRMGLARPL